MAAVARALVEGEAGNHVYVGLTTGQACSRRQWTSSATDGTPLIQILPTFSPLGPRGARL